MAGRVVVGDVGDPATVRDALDGVDAVAHFAAIPAPVLGTPEEVFCGNTRATFVVLEEAGQAGVRRAAIASSYSVLGFPWASRPLHPAYLPIDEALPLQVEDPYGLSKQADEATAAMMARRYGMTVVALRFPLIGGPGDKLDKRAEEYAEDPGSGAAELWTYLDRQGRRPRHLAGAHPADRGLPRDLRDGRGHPGPATHRGTARPLPPRGRAAGAAAWQGRPDRPGRGPPPARPHRPAPLPGARRGGDRVTRLPPPGGGGDRVTRLPPPGGGGDRVTRLPAGRGGGRVTAFPVPDAAEAA
ncbi:NAD(P)-dependent oxidoreductase [Streptosporangium vulgare]|uniref:NAD-dependent epimerase/dehydratase family protein n=1 Tax=Streptosporangium vulgare TaxID=46190 RepID=UPI0031E14749